MGVGSETVPVTPAVPVSDARGTGTVLVVLRGMFAVVEGVRFGSRSDVETLQLLCLPFLSSTLLYRSFIRNLHLSSRTQRTLQCLPRFPLSYGSPAFTSPSSPESGSS